MKEYLKDLFKRYVDFSCAFVEKVQQKRNDFWAKEDAIYKQNPAHWHNRVFIASIVFLSVLSAIILLVKLLPASIIILGSFALVLLLFVGA